MAQSADFKLIFVCLTVTVTGAIVAYMRSCTVIVQSSTTRLQHFQDLANKKETYPFFEKLNTLRSDAEKEAETNDHSSTQATTKPHQDFASSIATFGSSPNDYVYGPESPALCQDKHVFIVVCVPSSRDKFEKRKEIREKWGRGSNIQKSFNISLAFFVGSASSQENASVQLGIDNEHMEHKDLIQGRFLDTYRNLTTKSVMMVNWVSEYCKKALFMLKADDDIRIDFDVLRTSLTTTTKMKNGAPFLMGFIQFSAPVTRDKKSKFYVSFEQYNKPRYPAYCSGPAYAMNAKAVSAIAKAARTVTRMDMEDVYITGLCAEKASVTHVNNHRWGSGHSMW